MRNNKRQFVGALVMAAMMAVALPLSAEPKIKDSGRDKCTFMYGVLVMKANLPQAVQDIIIAVFNCEDNWG